jgi:hypothetical protein
MDDGCSIAMGKKEVGGNDDLHHGVSYSLIMGLIDRRILMDDGRSMPYCKLLSFHSFVAMQQKDVGGNNGFPPVNAITFDTHAKWSAKEGVRNGMVRSTSWGIPLSHYLIVWPFMVDGC